MSPLAHSRLHRSQTRNLRSRNKGNIGDKKEVKTFRNSTEAGVRLYERALMKRREKDLRMEALLEEERSCMFQPKINLVSSYITTDKNEDDIPIEDRLILHGELYNKKHKIREEIIEKMTVEENSRVYRNEYHPSPLQSPSSPETPVPIHARSTGKLKIEVPSKKQFKKTTEGNTHIR